MRERAMDTCRRLCGSPDSVVHREPRGERVQDVRIVIYQQHGVVMRYDIKNEDDLREAARKVSELGSNGKTPGAVVKMRRRKKHPTT